MRWKNAPLVSVVTVCRNAEKEVERTIQSVIQQDFPDFEYWIVDGLSTDNTVDTIEPYRKRLAGFVSEHDTGIYNAMNKAARLVKGQWIIFMNAGDTFASTHVLSDVFSKIDESTLSKTDVIYGETIQKRSVGDFKLPNRPLHYILRGMAFCHQSVFVKTFLLRKFPFNEDYRVVADYDFFYQLYLQHANFLFLPVEVSCFEAETGVSRVKKLQAAKEKAIIQNIDHTLRWKIGFALSVCLFHLKNFFLILIPQKTIDWIRHKNYQRKANRCC